MLLSLSFWNSIPGVAPHTKLAKPSCCVCLSLEPERRLEMALLASDSAGGVQGVQHPPGMMSQQCLPPGCPGSQPRCRAACLRSPYLKEMIGDPTVTLQYSLNSQLLPSPWQQQGDPRKGEEDLVNAGSWAGLDGATGNESQHGPDPRGSDSTRICPRSCLRRGFPWCCPHLLRLYIHLLSCLSVLGHLPAHCLVLPFPQCVIPE